MNKSLRILNVEDSERDVSLLRRHLASAGYVLTTDRVQTAHEMAAALKAKEWDVVLCDYSMPQFNALGALKVLQDSGLDIPLIIISGTVGEDVAVEAMRAGANDYLMKDNLTRLEPTIERELLQAENRRAQRQAEDDRRQSEERYRTLFEYAPDGIIISSPDDYYLDANSSMCEMLGYTHKELVGLHARDIVIRSEVHELDSEFALVQASSDYNREWHFRRKDGSEFPGEVIATIMPDGNLLAMIRDISERKQADEKLFESESLLASSQRITHLGSWVIDISDAGEVIENTERWSDEHYRIFGFEPGQIEITDEVFYNSVHPDDRETLAKTVREAVEQTKPFVVEHRIILPDGQERTVQAMAEVVLDEKTGKPLKLLGSVQDITERKLTQAALAESEDRYRDLVEHSHDLICTHDLDGRILSVNQTAAGILGYDSDALLGLDIREIVVSEFREGFGDYISEIQKNGMARGLMTIQTKSGEERIWEYANTLRVEGVAVPIVRGVAHDVTEQRRAEAALSKSETRYRELVENAIDIIYTQDLEGNYTSINKAGERITGFTMEESLARNVRQAVAPEYRNKAKEMTAAKLAGLERTAYELEIIAKDGHRVPVEVNTRIVYEDGVAVGVQGIARDITERKRSEAERLASERKYQDIFNLAPVGIYQSLRDGTMLTVNTALVEMLGYDSADEILDKNLADVYFDPEERRELINLYEDRGFATDIEIRWKRKDGSPVWIQLTSHAVRSDEEATVYFEGFVRDVTESKQMNEALRESESRLRTIIATEPECVKLMSQDGSLLEMNPAGLRMIEADSFEQVADRSVFGLIADDDRSAFRDLTNRVFQGESGMLEFQLIGLKGTHRWLDTHASPLRDATGKITALLAITRDVTEGKRAHQALRESNEKFQQLAENITDAFWIRSLDMREVHYVSPAFEKIWGRSVESLYAEPHKWAEFIFPEDRELVHGAFARLTGEESELDIEYRIMRPDGEIRWIRVRGFKVKDATGALIRYAGIVTDITERKMIVEALSDSEERYRELVENAIDIIYTHDLKGNYTSVNKAAETITGYTNAEILAKNIADTIPAGQLEKARGMIAAKLAGEGETAYELELLAKSGDGIPVEVKTRIIYANGVPVGVQGIARDITERKLAEAALNQSKDQLTLAAESVNLGIWDWDVVENKLEWDDRMYELYGVQETDFSGAYEAWQKGLHPDDREQGDANIQAALRGERQFSNEFRVLWANGEVHHLEARALVERDKDGTATRMVGVNWDITERKLAEEFLQKSEIQYRALFDGVKDGIYRTTHDGRFVDLNDAMVHMFGYSSKEEMLQVDIVKDLYFAEGDRESHFPDNVTSSIDTYRMRTKNGSEIWVEDHGQYVYDEQGNVLFHEGTLRDITERKIAEQALAAAEENYRSIFENAIEGIFQSTNEGRFISANPAMARILGFDSPADLLASRTDIGSQHYVDPASRIELERILAEQGIAAAYECEVYKKDRTKIWTQENIRAICGADGQIHHYEGSLEDITARKSLEDQFRQSQKMEAVGVMAGGIAHDFNNLLTAINGYSDLTLRKMPADDPLRPNIEQVKDAGSRAAELTSQLLAFSRKQVLKPVVHNLNAVIGTIEKMLRRIIRENIELRTVLAPDLGNIKADPGQIEQVIMNLAVNARDAMPDGGTLKIETENVYLDNEYISQKLAIEPGPFVRMTVTDTGVGIDAATQQHMFEPFFTTKEVGKGTGLGLSMVHGIVKQSGGDIMVYSEPGHGTTFKIYLPRVDEGVERPQWHDNTNETQRGTETILLVEDEEVVRRLVYEILTGNGYTVLEAANGKAALEICSSYDGHIDMMLTDVIMPSISGVELKQAVVALLPDIKVMFMSGYTDDAIADRGVFEADIAFIEKPFTPDALSRKVREVLHG